MPWTDNLSYSLYNATSEYAGNAYWLWLYTVNPTPIKLTDKLHWDAKIWIKRYGTRFANVNGYVAVFVTNKTTIGHNETNLIIAKCEVSDRGVNYSQCQGHNDPCVTLYVSDTKSTDLSFQLQYEGTTAYLVVPETGAKINVSGWSNIYIGHIIVFKSDDHAYNGQTSIKASSQLKVVPVGNVVLTTTALPSAAKTNEPVSFQIEGHVENASVTNPAVAIEYVSGPADYITIKRGDGIDNLQKGYMLLKYTQSTQNPCYYLRSWEGSPSWDSVIFPTAGDYTIRFHSGVVTETSGPVSPPAPGTPAPIANPSFEQGLQGWTIIRYAPHPTPVDNADDHLVEVQTNWKTAGQYGLHIKAAKITTRNVVCAAYQDIDLSKAVSEGYKTLAVDIKAILDQDSTWLAPWCDPDTREKRPELCHYTFVDVTLGNKIARFINKGTYERTLVFDITDIAWPARLEFHVQLWDQHPTGSCYELYADNIRLSR